jgi:hypothetical protein
MVNLRQTEEIENKIAELLVAKFDISDSLLKEVTKKITSLANRRVEETFKKTKDSLPNKGITAIAKETLKTASAKKEIPKDSSSLKGVFIRLDLIQETLSSISEGLKVKSTIKDKKIPILKMPKIPEFKIPKIKMPKIPEFKIPKIKMPKIPEFKIPKIKMPKIPEFKIPKIKMPKIPEFKIPKIKMPKIPEFKIPKIKMPKIPEFKIPKIKMPKILKSSKDYSIKDRFKESGLIGLTKDLIKNLKGNKEKPIKKEKYSIKDRFKESGLIGLTRDFFKNFKLPFLSKEKSSDKGSFLGSIKKILPKKEPTRLTKDEQKPSKVLLEGITENGFKDLVDKMPKILKGIFDKKTEKEKDKKQFSEKGLLGLLGPGLLGLLKGALMVGGGIALLLGGLAALITGLNTDGPFKGLLKILSNVGLTGGLKLLEKGAQVFLKNIKSLINAPVNIMKMAYKGLRGIFGKGISKTITTALGKSVGLLSKIAAGVVKFITPLLRRLPLVGTIISFAFAYSRFKSGDTVGGVIDILSGLVNLLSLTGVGAPLAIAISTGLDVLNAFLDYKTGGSGEEAAKKKKGMVGDFFSGMGKWIYEKSKNLPIIGRLIKAGEAFINKDWAKGIVQLSRLVPGTGWVLDFFGTTEEKQEQTTGMQLNVLKGATTWIKEKIWDKVFGFAGRIWEGTKKWWENTKNWWIEKTEGVGNYFKNIGSGIKNFAGSIKDKIQNRVSEFASKVKDNTKKWWENTKNWWSEVKEDVSESYLGKQFFKLTSWMKDNIWNRVTGFASKIKEGIKGWWNKLTDWWSSDNGKIPQDIEQGSTSMLGNLASWMKESIWDKVTGFAGKIMDSVKEWWGKIVDWWDGEETSTPPEPPSNKETVPQEADVKMADGGIVTQPTQALVGEAGPEAVIPLDQYMSPEGFKISNDILQTIASNTGNTNDTIRNLSQAILKLADVFNQKSTQSPNNIIVNGQNNQPQQYPSASQVAANNVDPIRAVRAQFAI